MKNYSICIVLAFTLCQCKSTKIGLSSQMQTAEIIKEGFITCFEKGTSLNGKPVWCEASGVLSDGKSLFFSNDKEMPGTASSVFYWNFKNGFADTTVSAIYLSNPVLKHGIKYEDFALTPNGKFVLLTTAFDRVKTGSTEWDRYNSICYWAVLDGVPNPKVISTTGTDSTSVYLRAKIAQVLATDSFPSGPPYFKIEGLAATENKIYFGVREVGIKYDNFKYVTKIISVSYTVQNNTLSLADDFSLVADINIATLMPSLPQKSALSSIEYDKRGKQFILLTSFEDGDKVGGHLWTATLGDLQKNTMKLVKNINGEALTFTHKPEDLTIVGDKKILIIHDDDRLWTFVGDRKRNENQAAFSIVSFK